MPSPVSSPTNSFFGLLAAVAVAVPTVTLCERIWQTDSGRRNGKGRRGRSSEMRGVLQDIQRHRGDDVASGGEQFRERADKALVPQSML